MKRFAHLIFVSLLGAVSLASVGVAGSPILFNLSGTFETGSPLSGTLTIDTATGVVTAVHAVVGPPDSLTLDVTFDNLESQGSTGPNSYDVQVGNGSMPHFDLFLEFPGITSLIGYTGNHFCSISNFADCVFTTQILFVDTLTERLSSGSASIAEAIPEPAMLALLGVGLAGLGFARRRYRDQARAA